MPDEDNDNRPYKNVDHLHEMNEHIDTPNMPKDERQFKELLQ
jgi:hypothetical protein